MSDPYFTEALARARACRKAQDGPGALLELRRGLEGALDYAAAVAAARFLDNTTAGRAPAGWPVRRVALIGADALEFLRPVVRTLAFRDGWWPEFYEAPFGAWRQEILDGQSALRAFQPDVTLVLRSWRSAGLPALADDPGEAAERIAREDLALAQRANEGLGLVLWSGFDFPTHDVLGAMGRHQAGARRAVLAEVNQRLRHEFPAGMLWVDLAEAQAAVGLTWEDARWWHAARQHPSAVGSVTLVELWLALLRARWGAARKVLITDLDNTLWGGVVGEDGVDGLQVGAGTAVGEAHAAYQEYLVELKSRGVLLAVCSKNNSADAAEVFARRTMPLRREDFSGWMVNWEDKVENLRALARMLNVGLDSFVFVDDNPAERARVRAALPEVAVPELPTEPAEFITCLNQRRFFEPLTVSAEDRQRHGAYQANLQRAESQQGAASVEDFLCGLEMTGERESFSEKNRERVAQLLARTNQWNLTTRRHGAAELTALGARPDVLTQAFRLGDRFGDNGLVGLWIAIARGGAAGGFAPEWEIDSWLMSCRVIGRGLEDLMFNALVEMTRARGGRRLHGLYRPTAKNALVADWLSRLGFQPEAGQEGAFVLELQGVASRPHFIGVPPISP
jgi:FkbH-like protein